MVSYTIQRVVFGGFTTRHQTRKIHKQPVTIGHQININYREKGLSACPKKARKNILPHV